MLGSRATWVVLAWLALVLGHQASFGLLSHPPPGRAWAYNSHPSLIYAFWTKSQVTGTDIKILRNRNFSKRHQTSSDWHETLRACSGPWNMRLGTRKLCFRAGVAVRPGPGRLFVLILRKPTERCRIATKLCVGVRETRLGLSEQDLVFLGRRVDRPFGPA